MEARDKAISIEAHRSPRWVLKGIKRFAAERKQRLGRLRDGLAETQLFDRIIFTEKQQGQGNTLDPAVCLRTLENHEHLRALPLQEYSRILMIY